jgi:cytochrome c oxidase cbb3-type subunit 1
MRVAGGALYLIGALIMVYNLIRTVRGERREEVPMGAPVAVTS